MKTSSDEVRTSIDWSFLAQWNDRLLRVPYWIFAALLVIAQCIRLGPNFHALVGPAELAQGPGESFIYLNSSVGPNIIVSLVRLLHLNTFTLYELFAVVWTILAFAAVSIFARRFTLDEQSRRVTLVLVILGPIGVVLVGHSGSNDTTFMVATLLIGLFPRSWTCAIAGALLLILSNPGQALLVSVMFLLMSLIAEFRVFLRSATLLLIASLVGFALVLLQGARTGGQSQASPSAHDFMTPLTDNPYVFPLLIYSGFGVLTVVLLMPILTSRRWTRLFLIGLLFVFPAAMGIVWHDGTRHIVNLIALPVAMIFVVYLPRALSAIRLSGRPFALALVTALALLLPAVHVFGGVVRQPYQYVIDRTAFYIGTFTE